VEKAGLNSHPSARSRPLRDLAVFAAIASVLPQYPVGLFISCIGKLPRCMINEMKGRSRNFAANGVIFFEEFSSS